MRNYNSNSLSFPRGKLSPARCLLYSVYLYICSYLFYIGILLSSIVVKVNALELTGCDCVPKADDSQEVVRYCPELNYTVVLECRANDAASLEWNITELTMPFSFHVDSVNNSMCDDDTSGGITYSLIKMMENNYGHYTYTSQLRVHTSYLRGLDQSNMTVTCQATSEIKKMLLVKISGIILTFSLFILAITSSIIAIDYNMNDKGQLLFMQRETLLRSIKPLSSKLAD